METTDRLPALAPSELILNADGSIFHLHLRPEQLAEKIILVGDPARVDTVASFFDRRECEVQNREFHSVTGTYEGKRLTIVSTGIGCDNIDIVINELDALANIDFATRRINPVLRSLDIVRIGTCGGLQPATPVGSFVVSAKSIGFDGLLNFYALPDNSSEVRDRVLERALLAHLDWQTPLCLPYAVSSDAALLARISADDMVQGITVSFGGFYAPQGRQLRLPLADPAQNSKLEAFTYDGLRVTNFEMESSAVAGLSALLGHRATTCCLVIANRTTGEANADYRNSIETLIEKVLKRV